MKTNGSPIFCARRCVRRYHNATLVRFLVPPLCPLLPQSPLLLLFER